MNLLEIKDLDLKYQTPEGETHAIERLDMTVKQGEFVAVVGPSGCGKTTLLSIIAGLIKPSGGKILLGGAEVNGVNPRIGYMLQKDQLFEWRTVLANVLLGLEIKKMKTPQNVEYAKLLLEKYGLKDFMKSYPRNLSGGMRQRAALIRTLAFKPDILLLDEPFSALDFQTRLSVCDDVYRIIKSENKTTVLVTHDVSEAVSMADRVFVLTKRPATVKSVFEIKIDKPTPLEKREDDTFSHWFNKIRREIPS